MIADPTIIDAALYAGTVWMPTDPPRPAPMVMTEAEVIVFLRLDTQGADAKQTLFRYRNRKLLKAARIGRSLQYELGEVLRFVRAQTGRV